MGSKSKKVEINPYHFFCLLNFIELSAVGVGVATIPKICQYIYTVVNANSEAFRGSSFSNVENRNPTAYQTAHTFRTAFLLPRNNLLYTAEMLDRALSYISFTRPFLDWDDFASCFALGTTEYRGNTIIRKIQEQDERALSLIGDRLLSQLTDEEIGTVKHLAKTRVRTLYKLFLAAQDIILIEEGFKVSRAKEIHLETIEELENIWRGYPYQKKIDRSNLLRKNKNIYSLFIQDEVIATVTIIPLKKSAYELLSTGKLKEYELAPKHIYETENFRKAEHFYFSFGSKQNNRGILKKMGCLLRLLSELTGFRLEGDWFEHYEDFQICTFSRKNNYFTRMLGFDRKSIVPHVILREWNPNGKPEIITQNLGMHFEVMDLNDAYYAMATMLRFT